MKKKMPNSPPLPPPLPPLPRLFPAKPVKVKSVTRDEIARFWRRKKIEEEDHLLAAIKAAARIRARRLMVRIIISNIAIYFAARTLFIEVTFLFGQCY